ncbi:MAG: hypothetical protein ACT4PV_14630 [Planctomycetaceae bacterium]
MADRTQHRRFMLGLGLDSDGHARITRGEDYVLVGGSESTHERMQEDVERFRHELKRRGTDLQRATPGAMRDAARASGLANRRRRRSG